MYEILIVEDKESFALDLKLNLELNGYVVLKPCSSVELAMGLVQSEKPDLVLMDLNIKGNIRGIEAAIQINKLGIPIVFIKANNKSMEKYNFEELIDSIKRNLE